MLKTKTAAIRKSIKANKKKSAVGLGGLSILIIILNFWGDVYPVVCKKFTDSELCIAFSKSFTKAVTDAVVPADGGTP